MTDTGPAPAQVRFKKLKSADAIHRSARHTWRLDTVSYVDATRTHLNEDLRPVSGPEALVAAVEERLATVTVTARRTDNPVFCLEYLVTARREAFAEHGGEVDSGAYFRDAVAFLERRHGADNVVALNIQRDEHAPHLVAYVVPLVERPARMVNRSVFAEGRDEEGRQRREVRPVPVPAEVALSAWHYNGEPEQVAELQTEFAEEVAYRHGLERGLEDSAATHTPNWQHHAAIARAMAGHIGLTAEELERQGPIWNKESPEEQAARLSELIRTHYAPTVASAATAAHDRRRAREMVETARRHRARYRDERTAHEGTRAQLEHLTAGLAPEQCQALERQASEYRKENRRALGERKLAERRQEEAAKRDAAERQAREKAAKREKDETKAKMARGRDDEMARRLRGITPEAFARLGDAWRQHGWRLMRERDDLAAEFERLDASGLVDLAGRLTPEGAALVEGKTRNPQAAAPAEREPRRVEPTPNARPDTRAAGDLFDPGRNGPGL